MTRKEVVELLKSVIPPTCRAAILEGFGSMIVFWLSGRLNVSSSPCFAAPHDVRLLQLGGSFLEFLSAKFNIQYMDLSTRWRFRDVGKRLKIVRDHLDCDRT